VFSVSSYTVSTGFCKRGREEERKRGREEGRKRGRQEEGK